ncbi:MAG: acyltransferase [Solirubrobacteraceae bacterium]|nr:acyltransferase [Solirubrobacteraceae bacterium]
MKKDGDGFRADVEGLRAVAIGAVVLAHAGVGAAAGGFVGVDVFFVISGFLITGLLLRELELRGGISLTRFYARRAKRLLPLAALVLAAVSVAGALLLDPVRRDLLAGDVVAAALSVVNWRFAAQAVDYFAAGADASPVRHYWSLAVEEQFYLVWPALLLAGTWWARRGGRSVRRAAGVLLAAVGAASLAYGVWLTRTAADVAYFSTLTRAWELALGGLLALAGAAPGRLPPRAAAALGWAGLAAIVVACVAFDASTPFPGVAALLPTLGTVALIAGGAAAPLRVLTLAPVRYVGRISYSWYLWHWPLYVFAADELGPLSAWEGLAAMAVSLAPAIVTHHLVEAPLHHAARLAARPGLALRVGAACIAVSVVAGVLVSATAPRIRTADASEVEGARAIDPDAFVLQTEAVALLPNPRDAGGDQPRMYEDGCWQTRSGTRSPECRYAHADAKTTIVLYGDSHAAMYAPALEAIARRRGAALLVLSKQGCHPAEIPLWNGPLGRHYTECDAWRADALARIERERPVLVVTAGANGYATMAPDGSRRRAADSVGPLTDAYEATLRRLAATGAKVVALADTPYAPFDVPSCVAERPRDLAACAFDRETGQRFPPISARAARAAAPAGVDLVDLTPVLCPDGRCPSVIGNALVYRDSNHLTATYARTLAGWLSARLPRLAVQ